MGKRTKGKARLVARNGFMQAADHDKGVLITFEGGDGSGKKTQTKHLLEYLKSQGLPVRMAGYPMYDTPTGKLVADYLNGRYGRNLTAEEAGLLFQNDRKANMQPINDWVEQGGIQLLDRYVESNSGHQAGKLTTEEDRIAYIQQNAEVEYGENGLRVPDMTLLFTLPPKLAHQYVAKKQADSRGYTDLTHDIHEDDPTHLANANEAFMLLPKLYPERVRHINVLTNDGTAMKSMEEIHAEVREMVDELLRSKGYFSTVGRTAQ